MRVDRQAAAVLAGLVLCVTLEVAVRYEPYTFIRRDASFYSTVSMGLVKTFSLDQRRLQPQSWYSGEHPGYADLDMYWSNISVGRGGAWYPKHSFLVSVAAAPFYVAFGVPGFLIFNALCVVAMMWAAYLVAARFAPPAAAAIAALLTTASPMLVEHTYHLSADIFSAMLIALGVVALLAARPATAGALLGLELWARPVTAVLVVPVAAALVWRRFDRGQLRRLVVAAAIPLVAAALSNTVMYGAPWITSYDRILTVEGRVQKITTARALFTNPVGDGLRLMFASREHGLVTNALPSLVAVAGLVFLWRRQRLYTAALAVGLAGFLFAYVPYRYFNARFFFGWQALLCAPLAAMLADAGALGARAAETMADAWARARPRLAELPPRRLAVGAAAGVLLLGGTVVAAAAIRSRTYELARHVSDAKVFRNDFPCDYFNVTHQAWECSRIDRSADEYAGLAVRPELCRVGGEHWEALMLAPPSEGGTRRMRWNHLPRGPLDLDYALRDGSATREVCFTVAYGGRPPERVCTEGPGRRAHHRFDAPAEGAPRELEIAVEGRGPRDLCFDGVARR
jgi:hypothetical protein